MSILQAIIHFTWRDMEHRGLYFDGGQLNALPEVALQQAVLVLLRRLQDTKKSSAHHNCTLTLHTPLQRSLLACPSTWVKISGCDVP